MFSENDPSLNKLQYFIRKGYMTRLVRDSALNKMQLFNQVKVLNAYSTTGSPVVTVDGLYTVVKFTGSGSFVLTGNSIIVDSLVVAGGGGGTGGGGGAGGLIYTQNETISLGTYNVTVGAGGAGLLDGNPSNSASNGANSVFNSHTAIGGGGGGGTNNAGHTAASGGSGGGGGPDSANNQAGGAGTAGQGNTGGANGVHTGGNNPAGGGGGAGAVGVAGSGTQVSGAGGVGLSNSITGAAVFYAGGGGGMFFAGSGTVGAGGNGGGGAGAATNGVAGTANTGGGGGGSNSGGTGGQGGSGVVILRFLTSAVSGNNIQEVKIIESYDDSTSGQFGVMKFGDTRGETFLQGTTVKSLSPMGYGVGSGGTVTQATSKSTGATLSKVCGDITLNGAALAAGAIVSFVLTNTLIEATDILDLNHQSGGTIGPYLLNAVCAAGTATIYIRNTSAGSLSEAIVIRFLLRKAANS